MIVLPVNIFIRKQVIFMTINDLKDKVISGGLITIDDALFLSEADLDDLCKAADEIQHTFFGNDFDICAVVNVKGGKCSENCVYCSQSTCAKIPVKAHAMISPELLLRHARLRNLHDIRHYCLVSSGKRVSDKDIDKICNGIKAICRDTKLSVCTSFGLLGEEQFKKLKEAGVQASFDEKNQRFFISSKTSGKDGDFALVANDSAGMDSLRNLGLYTNDKTSQAEYAKWAKYYNADTDTYTAELDDIINTAYESAKTNFDAVAKERLDTYSKASSIVDSFTKKYTASDADTEVYKDKTPEERADLLLKDAKDALSAIEQNAAYKGDDGNFDVSKLSEEDKKKYDNLKTSISSYESDIKNYTEAKDTMTEYKNKQYVNIEEKDGKTTVTALKETDSASGVSDIQATVDSRNAETKAKLTSQYQAKAKNSYEMYSKMVDANGNAKAGEYSDSVGAVRINGQDAKIELNGAEFTSNTSTFSINGLTIQATAETKGDESVTITTDTDVDAIYKSIKDMFTEYNKLIKSMDEAYNADSSKGYEPLTDEEKDAMSDKEVEKWETKIKDSLLRKDDTLNSVANTLKNDMASSFIINGKSYALSSFGISTLGYFASGENEKGVYHIDGDKDDTTTSGNEDKLRAAIASDPETVVSFFSQLCTKLYTDLGNKMASSSVSSAYTIYNDKQMNTQYSEYNTKISDAESKVSTWEDYYYSKFSAMESALAKLNSQSSSMSGLFGS